MQGLVIPNPPEACEESGPEPSKPDLRRQADVPLRFARDDSNITRARRRGGKTRRQETGKARACHSERSEESGSVSVIREP